MKTLVTGVTGIFAPYLVRELLAHNHEVVLYARRQPPEEFKALEWLKGDINDAPACLAAMAGRGFDAVHHAAAMPDPTDWRGWPDYTNPAVYPLTMQTNIVGLYNMLHAAKHTGIGIFVNTGSNCVLGHGYRVSKRPFPIHYLPIDEGHPQDAEDSYSFSKQTGERLLEMYTRAYGMRCYSLRSCWIATPADRTEMKKEKNYHPPKKWNEWMYAWIAAEDLAAAHRLLMEQAEHIAPYGHYYCANDDTNAAATTMEIIKNTRPELIPLIREPLEGYASLFSSKRLKAATGWRPKEGWR
jgi:nucleoside-diphosphate-sugar epimerase